MNKRSGAWALVVGSVALTLAGCGGGSDNNSGGPGPEQPDLTARIEPFDTAATKLAAASQDTSVVHGLVAEGLIRSVVLGAPADSVQKALANAEIKPGTPIQIGVKREVQQTATVQATQALFQWQATASGDKVAAIAFESQQSRGVRLGVNVGSLPAGSVLRFYSQAGADAVQVTAAELAAQAERLALSGADSLTAHTYWSPDFGGDRTVLEVQVPASADVSQVQLAVPRLSHFTQSAEAVDEKAASGSCNIDVMCQPDYLDQSRSVARMIFTRLDGKSYYCTGTLMNDAKNSGTPYFLTANHCISAQAEASSLTTDWFYRSSACNSGQLSSGARRLTRGATLLYATTNTDTSFLQLNEAPPAGVVYAGSFYGNALASGTSVAAVHDPNGDLQKFSLGSVQRYGVCANDSCANSNITDGTFYGVNWQQGTTEGGSSGGALFYTIGSKRYVSGQLYGGTASCSVSNGTDYFGRFDIPFKARINQWLKPAS